MRNQSWIALVAGISLTLVAAEAFGQGAGLCKELRDWDGKGYGSLFDVSSVTTFEGRVIEIEHFVPATCMMPGMLLRVEVAPGEQHTVHLAPTWYLDVIKFRVHEGALVTVTGSRVRYRSQPIVLATAVTLGTRTMSLRDEGGAPIWRRWQWLRPAS
jgi:hypothetical protein